MRTVAPHIIMLAAATLSFGCASAKVTSEESIEIEPFGAPLEVLVHDFAYRTDQVSPEAALGARLYDMIEHADADANADALGREAADALSDSIVAGLQKLGLQARRVSADEPALQVSPQGVVRIEGQFIDVDAGNRLRRVVIGLGVGASNVVTQVQVFDSVPSGDTLVASFSTRARGGRKPGAAEMVPAGSIATGVTAVTSVALDHRQSTKSDAKRTGDLIVRRLATLAYQQGWIDRQAALEARGAE